MKHQLLTTWELSSALVNRSILIAGTVAIILGATDLLNRSPASQQQVHLFNAVAQPAVALELNHDLVALANGANITSPQGSRGHGTLRIINGLDTDAAIKLVDRDSGRTLRFVYVRANSRMTIEEIGQCTCILKYATGTDWDEDNRRFSQNQSFSRFDDLLEFEETHTSSTVYEATLNPVNGGNAPTTAIDERAFGN